MPRRPVLGCVLAFVAAALSSCAAPPERAATPAGIRAPAPAPTAARHTASPAAPCGWGTATTTYRHVVWIWMENRSYDEILGSQPGAPRLARYARRCGVATRYYAVGHPSLPNYVAAVTGGTQGITNDCSPSGCPVHAASLFGQLTAAGRHWRSWAESMSSRCDTGSYGRYAARHNPAVYLTRIVSACRASDRRMGGSHGGFARQLANDALPAFTFVTPNLCDDGHDCSTGRADTWLGGWLDRIVASRAYRAGRTIVFVTWDEGVGSDNRVATVAIAPTVARHTVTTRHFTHYSLLRTTEENLGLRLLGNARTARSMRHALGL
ncbi:MAG: hypothetical protein JO222_05095 [Frankiales bacterium]|nr:hypothetical protein [Frankiales bacterium]